MDHMSLDGFQPGISRFYDFLSRDRKRVYMELGLSRTQIVYIVDEWVLSARDREIVKRKLIDGVTFEELAEEQNLSVQTIKRVVYKALSVIKQHT